MSFGLSQMEHEREDIDAPLFMAWRIEIMPFKDIEIGLSRTAQFCGEQLECNWDVFWNMLIGNDNVGIDATAENEPGNQMAGFDLRWNSPIGNWPYALYAQYIGEDESSYVPAKYIAQLGVEMWKPMANGGLVQGFVEYSTTTCSANTGRGPYYNCAYNQGRFNVEGYRYHGRVIGYTADRDAENYILGGTFTSPDGEIWSATARTSRLNRDDFGDVRNTVASVPTTYNSLEFGWRGKLFGESIGADLGVELIEPEGGERDVQPYGFVRWTHAFGCENSRSPNVAACADRDRSRVCRTPIPGSPLAMKDCAATSSCSRMPESCAALLRPGRFRGRISRAMCRPRMNRISMLPRRRR